MRGPVGRGGVCPTVPYPGYPVKGLYHFGGKPVTLALQAERVT
jgi:hypothetical protein